MVSTVFDVAMNSSYVIGMFSFLFVLFQWVDNWNVKTDIKDYEASVYH